MMIGHKDVPSKVPTDFSRAHRYHTLPFFASLLGALFTLGCFTMTMMTNVVRTDSGQDQVGLQTNIEFEKNAWKAFQESGKASSDYSSLQKQGWKVTALEDGRIVNMTKDLTPLDSLARQGWKLTQRNVGSGRIVTATLDTAQVFGEGSYIFLIQSLFLVFDETDLKAPKYTFQATAEIPKSDPQSGTAPTQDCSKLADPLSCSIAEMLNDPQNQKLTKAIKDAGPGKLILGANLPGTIQQPTINGQAGGTVNGSQVQWTMTTDRPGTFLLQAVSRVSAASTAVPKATSAPTLGVTNPLPTASTRATVILTTVPPATSVSTLVVINSPPTAASGIPGDCDGDAKVTESDALCTLEMSVNLRPVRMNMDADNDGTVNSRDAVILLQRALGKR